MTITNDLLFQKAVKAMKFAALGIKNVSTCKTKKKKKKRPSILDSQSKFMNP